jgi:hypothetical protein
MGFEADYGGAKGAMTAGSEHAGRAYAMQSLPAQPTLKNRDACNVRHRYTGTLT